LKYNKLPTRQASARWRPGGFWLDLAETQGRNFFRRRPENPLFSARAGYFLYLIEIYVCFEMIADG
jgi:hypothetical protein